MKVTAVDIDGNKHMVSLDEATWRVHVYAIVIEEGKILLSPQHRENAYDLPGGKVDIGEGLEAAVVRECLEETGIEVRPIELVTAKDIIFKVTFREPQEVWHSVMMYYLCEKVGGDISTAGFDEHEQEYAQQAEWLPIDQLDSITPAASVDYRPIVTEGLERG